MKAYNTRMRSQSKRYSTWFLAYSLILHADNQACIHILRSDYSPKLRISESDPQTIKCETVNDLGLELQYAEYADQHADLFTKVFQG